MIKVYIHSNGRGGAQLRDGDGARIDVPTSTVTSAAKYGNVTRTLRLAVRAALNESVMLEDRRS